MIKIELNKPESEYSDFPKLMYGNNDWIVEVYKHPEIPDKFIGMHRAGPYEGTIATDFKIKNFQDFKGTITIQNA